MGKFALSPDRAVNRRVLFITVTDANFFPGTLATVHSIRIFHPSARILIAHNHVQKQPLLPGQRRVLENAGAKIVEAADLARPGRKLAAWELKAYAAADFSDDSDVLVGIDSDCVLCGPIEDIIDSALESNKFHGGKDGGGPVYDHSYAVYGIKTPVHNHSYISTSLYVCPLTNGNRQILQKWAMACDDAIFGGAKIYPGHGDQGVLNAVIWAARPGGDGVRVLDNRLWSQHHCYWQAPLSVRNGRLFNEQADADQRSIHCGGAEKFWTTKHREKVQEEGLQPSCFAWFLAMLWHGPGSLTPADLLPDQQHLVDSLASFRGQVSDLLPTIKNALMQTDAKIAAKFLKAGDVRVECGESNAEFPSFLPGWNCVTSLKHSSQLVFFTITNQNYFPGTIATLSSIRTFHPQNPIYVVSESRAPLTAEQIRHLRSFTGVFYLSAAELSIGSIREAWQMKAHVACYLARQYSEVIVQVDSDAVLCARVDELAAEATAREVPVGGQDGNGVTYPYPEYAPYQSLCGVNFGPKSCINPNYVSSSVLILPVKPLAAIFPLWSLAVDQGNFGPGWQKEKLYAGRGDQGVLNAILFFKGIAPHVIDNEIISEHWTHGRHPVTYHDGRFWNKGRQQIAFHSVGKAPKFWTADYRDFVAQNPHLRLVYSYWLFLLFEGSCGLLSRKTVAELQTQYRLLFPGACPELLTEYLRQRDSEERSKLFVSDRSESFMEPDHLLLEGIN